MNEKTRLVGKRFTVSLFASFCLGSLDCTVKLWDFTKLAEEMSLEDVNVSHNPDVKTSTESYLLRTFATKNTSILTLHFSRRNLLLGVGMFDST